MFSYIEMINSKIFPLIFGLSGTLEELHPEIKTNLKNFGIDELIYTPSLYGKS